MPPSLAMCRPVVVDMLHMVDVTHPLGLQSQRVLPPGNIITTTNMPCLDQFMRIKRKFPTAVGLVRVRTCMLPHTRCWQHCFVVVKGMFALVQDIRSLGEWLCRCAFVD
jgi:hypothetical protein